MADDLDNPVLEPSDVMYSDNDTDNAAPVPDEIVADASTEAPEDTHVESEELEAPDDNAEGTLVYQIGDREITEAQLVDMEKAYKDRKSMQADYTQKTQGVADKVRAETEKQVTEKLGDINAKANTLVEHATQLEALLNEVEGGVDLEELREDDYKEYQKAKETIDSRRTKLKEARDAASIATSEATVARLKEEHRLFVESNPLWTDDKGQPTAKREEDFKLIGDYSKECGYTDQEFGIMQNHKVLLTILEAAQFRKLKAKTTKSKKVKTAPKLVKPTKAKSTKTGATKSAEDIFYGQG